MKDAIRLSYEAVMNVLRTFFKTDLDVMSDEMCIILSDKQNARAYRKAVEELQRGAEEVTITLTNGIKLTLA